MHTVTARAIRQAAVSERYDSHLAFLDNFIEGYDEILTNYGLRMSRGMAWYNANRLLDPPSREKAVLALSKSPEITMREILDPPVRSLRLLFRGLRFVSRLGRRWPNA